MVLYLITFVVPYFKPLFRNMIIQMYEHFYHFCKTMCALPSYVKKNQHTIMVVCDCLCRR